MACLESVYHTAKSECVGSERTQEPRIDVVGLKVSFEQDIVTEKYHCLSDQLPFCKHRDKRSACLPAAM
jgi:hypothetical protein